MQVQVLEYWSIVLPGSRRQYHPSSYHKDNLVGLFLCFYLRHNNHPTELYLVAQSRDTEQTKMYSSTKSLGLQLLLSILLLSPEAIVTAMAQQVPAGRYDPLSNWLWNLTVLIPDQHFKESIFSLDIRDMACSHFAVQTIHSNYLASNDSSPNPAIDLTVAGISATCDGKYHTTGLSGKVSATVGSSSSVDPLRLSLVFQSNTTDIVTTTTPQHTTTVRLATQISAEQCDPNLAVTELHFAGSISAKLINLFRSEIRDYVSQALSSELCPVLTNVIDTNLTNLLQEVDRYMIGLIKDAPGIPNKTTTALQHKEPSPAWNWNRHAPLVPTILRLLNGILEPFLHEGVVLKILKLIFGHDDIEDNCGFLSRGWNGLVRQWTEGTVDIPVPAWLPFLHNISIVIPHYASISILPKQVSISGVDQLDRLQLLAPRNQTNDFWTKLVVSQGWNLTVALDVTVSETPGGAFQGDELMESFQLVINTSSLEFSSMLSLDLSPTHVRTTTMNHLLAAIHGSSADLGCSLSPIEKFGIEALVATVGIQSVSFWPADVNATLEHDIDGMINNVLTLFLTEYDQLVTLAFAGLLNGPAKQLAETASNRWIQELIRNLLPNGNDHCPSSGVINTTTPDYFNFSEGAKFLDRFNDFLNDKIDTTNEYLECVADVVETQFRAASPIFDYAGTTLQLQNLQIDRAGSIQGIGKRNHWSC
jgi:hypothetical protein